MTEDERSRMSDERNRFAVEAAEQRARAEKAEEQLAMMTAHAESLERDLVVRGYPKCDHICAVGEVEGPCQRPLGHAGRCSPRDA